MKLTDRETNGAVRQREPVRLAIMVPTGRIRSPKRSMILSSQPGNALAPCDCSRQLVDARATWARGTLR